MPTRIQVIAEARGWIGTPYRHQASLRGVGCDCLGLVRGVWRAAIGEEPETPPAYSPGWAEASGQEALAAAGFRHLAPVALDAILPGDVVLFRWRGNMPAKHAAIVTAMNGDAPALMVHAHDGAAVAEVAIAPWWRRRLAFAFRFPGIFD